MAPSTGRSSPEIARMVVDLPAPFDPMMVTISPGRTSRLTLSSTGAAAIAGGELDGGQDRVMRAAPRRRARARAHLAAAEIGLEHPGIVADLDRGSGGDAHAGIEHDHRVRDAHHQQHVVLDQDDGDAEIGDAPDEPAEGVLVGTHQAGGGLVEQQHAWTHRQRARDLDQAAIDVREIPAGTDSEP